MNLDLVTAWQVTHVLIAVAVLLQSIELLQLRSSWRDGGIWDWRIIRDEFKRAPAPLRGLLDLVLGSRGFTAVIALRAVAAIALILFTAIPSASFEWSPALITVIAWYLFGASLITCVRWRGTFNGGSDYMTLIVLTAQAIAVSAPDQPQISIAMLGYVAVQAVLSYFVAGIVKIKNARWRNGQALADFLRSSNYPVAPAMRRSADSAEACFAGAWIVMLFECGFPAVLAISTRMPAIAIVWLGAGLAFHLANAYIFGLNRFLFAWVAAYPALIFSFCSR